MPDEPESVSWIAQERAEPGAPSNQWVMAIIILAGVAFLVLAVMGLGPIERTDAEEAYRMGDGPVQALDASLSPSIARILRAAGAAVAVLGTAFVGRRLLHSEPASVLAAGLLLLDPGFLVHGRLATPVALATGASMLAVAFFLSPRRNASWAAAILLGFAAFLDPAYLAWGVPLALMALVRGHIYAAPQHAATAGVQALLIPGVGALMGIIGGDSLAGRCYLPGRFEALPLLSIVDLGDSIHWHPNPVLWFAGLGALLWLGISAAVHVMRDFRLQRLPGRIQARLTEPLARSQGRALWLLALAALAPTAANWMPLFALAIGAAVLDLSGDARRFGWAVGAGLLLIAIVYTVRLWPLLVGATDAPIDDLLQTVPWSRTISC